MIRTVTSTEAKNSFGELVKWASVNDGGVLIKHHGEPTAAIISYSDYKQLQDLKMAAAKRRFAIGLRMLRNEVQANLSPDTTDEESFREAGFSEEVIRDLLADDENEIVNRIDLSATEAK